MWLFRIPVTFGHVKQKAGNPLPTSVRSGDLGDDERNDLEESYSMRTVPYPGDQGVGDDLLSRSLISECSIRDARTPPPKRILSYPRVDYVRYNGSISSMQMILLLLAVSMSTTLAALLSQDFKPLISMLTLILYMLVGLLVMILFLGFRRRLVVSRTASNEEELTDTERDNLTLIGIVIFYLLVCVLDMFHIVAALDCRAVWTSCSNRDILFNFVVEVFFHAARIVYLGVKVLPIRSYFLVLIMV